MVMVILMMQLLNQKNFQGEHDYGGKGVCGATLAPNPFDASSLPDGLLEPLTSQLMKSKNGEGLLPSPKEHLSKDPCGKWRVERELQRAALKERVYLHNKVEKVKKRKGRCGWWGRRAARKKTQKEVAEESQPPKKKKKTMQGHNYGKKSKENYCGGGRANPFPTLDLSAEVIK